MKKYAYVIFNGQPILILIPAETYDKLAQLADCLELHISDFVEEYAAWLLSQGKRLRDISAYGFLNFIWEKVRLILE